METAVPVGCVVLDVAVAQCKLGTPCNGRLPKKLAPLHLELRFCVVVLGGWQSEID